MTGGEQYSINKVPNGLRQWFIVHFIIDIIVALPLFLMPEKVLMLFAWPLIDPLATRLVAAALFAIGIESFIGRNATIKSFEVMLNLKIIWSSFSVAGIAWTMLAAPACLNGIVWVALFTFLFFLALWSYWRLFLLFMYRPR